MLATLTTFAKLAGVKRTGTTEQYGKVYGARFKGQPAKQIEALAKSKSTSLRIVRPADIVRIAVIQYLERNPVASRNSTARAAA